MKIATLLFQILLFINSYSQDIDNTLKQLGNTTKEQANIINEIGIANWLLMILMFILIYVVYYLGKLYKNKMKQYENLEKIKKLQTENYQIKIELKFIKLEKKIKAKSYKFVNNNNIPKNEESIKNYVNQKAKILLGIFNAEIENINIDIKNIDIIFFKQKEFINQFQEKIDNNIIEKPKAMLKQMITMLNSSEYKTNQVIETIGEIIENDINEFSTIAKKLYS